MSLQPRSTPSRRSVVHLDADAFFASVEQAAEAKLRGRPVAVGSERRGIVASASYEARRLGIHTPMPMARARRLCPELVVRPGDYERYERFSRFMFSYAYDFTPMVELASIDEGYFDLSGCRGRDPVEVAATIRRAIGQSLKLSVSEGIGTNKLVAQVAAKAGKPAAFARVAPGEERRFLEPLPNRWLPGVGPTLSATLDAAGLRRIGQIALVPPEELALFCGSLAPRLSAFAAGIDERPVEPERPEAKSYGRQETFVRDATDEAFVLAKLRQMADGLMAEARAAGKAARTVSLRLRYNDMEETRRSYSFREPTDLESDVYPLLERLLRRAWQRRVSLRLVGVALSNVYAAAPLEFNFEGPGWRRGDRQRLARVVDGLREAGLEVMRGHDLWLKRQGGEPRPDLPGAAAAGPGDYGGKGKPPPDGAPLSWQPDNRRRESSQRPRR